MVRKSPQQRVTAGTRSRRNSSLRARLEDLLSPFSQLPFGSAVSPAVPDVGLPVKRRRTPKRAHG